MQQSALNTNITEAPVTSVNSVNKHSITNRLMQFYSSFSASSMAQISTLYAKNVVFKDPIHEVKGLNDLHDYFLGMMKKTTTCEFEFLDYSENSFYSWKMYFTHPKINGGQQVAVEGVSHIKVDEESHLITYQQDYYDMGAMLYEHLPVLGWSIDKLKSRMK